MALRKYKMHAVVANELTTRKEEVTLVTNEEKITVRRVKSEGINDVEDPLIKLLQLRHSNHIEESE